MTCLTEAASTPISASPLPGQRRNWRPRRVPTGSVKPRSTTTVSVPLVSAHTK
jgi:hypothetical protein